MKIIGVATGLGAQDPASGQGPFELKNKTNNGDWLSIIETKNVSHDLSFKEKVNVFSPFFQELSKNVEIVLRNKDFPLVIGGDHSCAIGSWRGFLENSEEDVGLIWLDAHLDSHTIHTTPSKAIHGMPLACLLGYGENEFVPKKILKPENVFIFGARSWEKGEKDLLDFLGVKIYDMDEIKDKGIQQCLSDIFQHFKNKNLSFGMSLDLDMFDPLEIPAVCSKEINGIEVNEFMNVFKNLNVSKMENLKMFEIVEFAPNLDKNNQTLNLIMELINIFKQNKP